MFSSFYLLPLDEQISKEQEEETLVSGATDHTRTQGASSTVGDTTWKTLKRRRGACQHWDYKSSFRGMVEKQKLLKRHWTQCMLLSPPNVLEEELLTLQLEFSTWWSEENWFSSILFGSSQPWTLFKEWCYSNLFSDLTKTIALKKVLDKGPIAVLLFKWAWISVVWSADNYKLFYRNWSLKENT